MASSRSPCCPQLMVMRALIWRVALWPQHPVQCAFTYWAWVAVKGSAGLPLMSQSPVGDVVHAYRRYGSQTLASTPHWLMLPPPHPPAATTTRNAPTIHARFGF